MTDHKRIAGDALDSLGEWFSQEGMTDATMVSSAIAAQASATLYLSEQQRIANLIAYTAKLSGPPADLTNMHATDVSDFRVMVEAIRTELGLA